MNATPRTRVKRKAIANDLRKALDSYRRHISDESDPLLDEIRFLLQYLHSLEFPDRHLVVHDPRPEGRA